MTVKAERCEAPRFGGLLDSQVGEQHQNVRGMVRVLRYAAEFKDLDEPLGDFISARAGSTNVWYGTLIAGSAAREQQARSDETAVLHLGSLKRGREQRE